MKFLILSLFTIMSSAAYPQSSMATAADKVHTVVQHYDISSYPGTKDPKEATPDLLAACQAIADGRPNVRVVEPRCWDYTAAAGFGDLFEGTKAICFASCLFSAE